jgi:hypothetical protein
VALKFLQDIPELDTTDEVMDGLVMKFFIYLDICHGVTLNAKGFVMTKYENGTANSIEPGQTAQMCRLV